MKKHASEPPEDKEIVLPQELVRPRSRRGVVIGLTAGGLVVGTGLAGTAWWFFTHRSPTESNRPFITPTPFPTDTPTPEILPTSGFADLPNEWNGTRRAIPDSRRFINADGQLMPFHMVTLPPPNIADTDYVQMGAGYVGGYAVLKVLNQGGTTTPHIFTVNILECVSPNSFNANRDKSGNIVALVSWGPVAPGGFATSIIPDPSRADDVGGVTLSDADRGQLPQLLQASLNKGLEYLFPVHVPINISNSQPLLPNGPLLQPALKTQIAAVSLMYDMNNLPYDQIRAKINKASNLQAVFPEGAIDVNKPIPDTHVLYTTVIQTSFDFPTS